MTLQKPANINLKITNINEENKKEKLVKAVAAIAEMLGIEPIIKAKAYEEVKKEDPHYNQEWQIMPKSYKQLHELYADKQQNILASVISGVRKFIKGNFKKAKGDDPFKINGKIIYSNQTGAPLTEKEWDSIRKDISGYLQDFYVKNGYQLGEESAIMSGILNDMERNGKSIANVDIKRLNTQDTFAEYLKDNDLTQSNYIGMYGDFSQVAQKAVNMSDRVKNDIVDVLQQGLREGKSDWEIEQALREMNKDDGKWSKDWARISKTEIVDVRANMDMTESLDLADGSPVYKKGVGHPNACKLCKRDVINKIVRVLPKAPDEDYKDPNADDFIWPGKSSIGYGANDPVAVITRHPHCACRWADWVPGM